MLKNAYGSGSYVYGQGKGFPTALPQTSVGSTNAFARRAIARRAGGAGALENSTNSSKP